MHRFTFACAAAIGAVPAAVVTPAAAAIVDIDASAGNSGVAA